MKKFILSLFVVLLSFIGFSSADLTISWNGVNYTPNEVAINGSDLYSENFNCSSDFNCCSMSIYTTNDVKVCEILYCNEEGDYFSCEGDLDGDYIIKYDNVYDFNSPFTNILLPNTIVIGGNNNPPVVPDDPVIPDNPGNGGLLSSFTGVVSSLNSVVIDIFPYISYLGLGIIVAVVGFIAIRWLIIWTKGKIDSNFRSKRR